ncbi:hypothetical protein GYMLUDRAFT_263133 [Collybiopsis luxurians FD-317 M1]|uniref:Protein kinase domain-containing protein n=1 Tax=Collybiopsis luxurians FD-317 M1 TaxID=944289 RepID=A0A0D0C4M9_9AGAR|nr:hypothetical protein GYMLUDRAFT_263133 [Collybiopsis luxurians FD-317 M1]
MSSHSEVVTVYCYSAGGYPIYAVPFAYPPMGVSDLRRKLNEDSLAHFPIQSHIYDVSDPSLLNLLFVAENEKPSEPLFSAEALATMSLLHSGMTTSPASFLLAIPTTDTPPAPGIYPAQSPSSALMPPPPLAQSTSSSSAAVTPSVFRLPRRPPDPATQPGTSLNPEVADKRKMGNNDESAENNEPDVHRKSKRKKKGKQKAQSEDGSVSEGGNGDGGAGGSRGAGGRGGGSSRTSGSRSTNRNRSSGAGGGVKWPADSEGAQRKRARQLDGSSLKDEVVQELQKHGYFAEFKQHDGKPLLHAKKSRYSYIVKYGRKSAPEMHFFLKGLRHSNIITPRKIFEFDSFACALLPAYTVLTNLLTNKTRSAAQFYFMSHDLVRGVQYLHANGIAHMDIKPDNLVFNSSFKLLIIDFDLALSFKDEQEQINSGWRGSDFWMAPELKERRAYNGFQVDQYACGVVFGEMAGTAERTEPHLVWIQSLIQFSERLQCYDPSQRLSLAGWLPSSGLLMSVPTCIE